MHNKRTLLFLVATAVIATLASVGRAQLNRAAEDEANRVVGSWRVEVTPVSPPLPGAVNFALITSDGLIINSNESGLASIGNWEKTGPRQFAFTFTGFAGSGPATIRYKVRARLVLSQDGEAMDGPFVNDVFDAAGGLIVSVSGTVHATRQHVEPMP